jgi:ribosome-binding protein aMBF1 (putative translation factor)
MATYTITLTTEQETALAVLIQRTNTARAAQNPPLAAITVNDYIQARATEIASSYATQIRGETEAAVLSAYKLADSIKQSQVKTTLGL